MTSDLRSPRFHSFIHASCFWGGFLGFDKTLSLTRWWVKRAAPDQIKATPPHSVSPLHPCAAKTDLHAHVKPDPGILEVSQFRNVLRLETITLARMITDGGDVHQARVRSSALVFFFPLCQMCKMEGGCPVLHSVIGVFYLIKQLHL